MATETVIVFSRLDASVLGVDVVRLSKMEVKVFDCIHHGGLKRLLGPKGKQILALIRKGLLNYKGILESGKTGQWVSDDKIITPLGYAVLDALKQPVN